MALSQLPVDPVTVLDWADYTPSNTNVTVGSGTQVARWTRIGNTITVHWMLTFAADTSFDGNVAIGLPVPTSSSIATNQTLGAAWVFDGSTQWTAIARKLATSTVALSTDAGTVNATSPATLNTNDIVSLTVTYEAA